MNGEIRGNNGESILFQVNSSYYNYRGMVEKASKPVKYIHEKIFIPLEIAESALKNLLENEVSYRQSRGKLLVNLYGNFKIEPEIIDLDMIIIDPGHGGKAPGAMSILGDPEKNYTQIKVSNNNPDDFSYQPMMFLDFIDEEEKQKIKKEEASVKIPEKVVEKVSPVSKSINVNALNNIKKYSNMTPNKYDNNSIKKVQLKHGRIPNKDEQQIHSLGFIDDI
ncbi:MAG TPA: hypothetical protein PK683_11505 [Leptospiraceae bacterium]|nr:hypothetical protein [Leptospiraceae bacterium]